MFLHNFKYTLKILFQNKMLIFWTFAFPLIMATFFQLAFSNIENSERLNTFEIAIIDNEKFQQETVLKEALKSLSEEADPLFHITYTNETEAEKLLNEKKITGYLLVTESPKIIIKQNGINETVFQSVVAEIIEQEKIITDLIQTEIQETPTIDIDQIIQTASNLLQEDHSNIKDNSSTNLSYTLIEFYTLIAMTCLYAGTIGMYAVNNLLPNMSKRGMRISSSPLSKWNLILSSILASYVVMLIGIGLLFLYTGGVLHINYGANLGAVILLTLIGSFAGLSVGVFTSSIFKASENMKIGIIISFTMVCSFLSGMMGITMKYIIDKNAPILSKINPANMITDGLYSLYYYPTLDRYWMNILSLIIFSTVLIIISYVALRRKKYDSI